MKFNVASKTLQQQLGAVSKVINSKNALTILDNFLLSLKGNVLTITGSDQENTMTATLEVLEAEGEGIIAIPAKRLLDMLKGIPDQGVTLYINDDTKEIDLRFLNGHFNFMGINGNEYPQAVAHEGEIQTFSLPASVIQKGIENTLFAAGTEIIRPIMTGIYWDICPLNDAGEKQNNITFVASDTHKLVRYINSETTPAIQGSFIMPAKPASILRNLIGKEDADIEIVMDSKSATFKFSTYSLTCRFINGRYPNYNRVIPADNPFELTIDRISLLNAMRRVALFASQSSCLVRLDIRPNEVLLAAQDLDYSVSAEERLECEYDGNAMVIGFNAIYLIEVLNNISADTVIIRLSDPARPGIIVPLTQEEGEDVLTLLMPMQVMDF